MAESETLEGLDHFWYPIEEKTVRPTIELGEFIRKRDGFLLESPLDG